MAYLLSLEKAIRIPVTAATPIVLSVALGIERGEGVIIKNADAAAGMYVTVVGAADLKPVIDAGQSITLAAPGEDHLRFDEIEIDVTVGVVNVDVWVIG